MTGGSKRKKLTVEIDEKVWLWLSTYATHTTQSVPSVIRGAIQDFIDDVEEGADEGWWETWKAENRKKQYS